MLAAIRYLEGGINLLDEIAILWKQLTIHHAEISRYFSSQFTDMQFPERKADLLEKGTAGKLYIVLAQCSDTSENVGYCVAVLDAKLKGEIESLFVADDWRSKGIGKELVGKTVAWLDKHGAFSKKVNVAVGNESAFHFYEQWGFLPRVTCLLQKPEKVQALRMKQIDPILNATEILANLKAGAFLTVKSEELLNTMTISWGFLGIMWGKPSFIVAVRTTRYTYDIIEKAKDFSVSIPVNSLSAELALCGSKSGRDIDKFKEAKITTQSSQKICSPIIACPGYHLECKVAYKAPIATGVLEESYQSFYAQKDYHTHYFGEIVDCYKTE